jgi:hypothetical protein
MRFLCGILIYGQKSELNQFLGGIDPFHAGIDPFLPGID